MWEYSYLQHDGTKGMKWHQRLYQNTDGTYTPLGLARKRAQYQSQQRRERRQQARENRRLAREQRRNIRRNPRTMTNQELRDATERMRLEEQYRQALNNQHRARNWVTNQLSTIATRSAQNFTNKLTNRAGEVLANRLMPPSDAAQASRDAMRSAFDDFMREREDNQT